MGIIDIVVIALAALLGVVGLFRGFVKELFSLGGWIAGIAVAFLFSNTVAPIVQSTFGLEAGFSTNAITFIGLFIITFIVVKIIAHSLSKSISKGAIGAFDRLLGLAWGVGKAVIVVCLLFLAASYIGTLPLVGATVTNFIETDLKLATTEVGLGRYLYEHNFAKMLIDYAMAQMAA